MPVLTVREQASDDDFTSLRPLWGDPPDPVAITASQAALVVLDGASVAGLALGRTTPAGRRFDTLLSDGVSPGELLAALARAVPGKRVELLVRDPGPGLDVAATRAGWQPVYDHVAVCGSLTQLRRPRQRPLTFRGYGEVGRRGMLAVLAGIWPGGVGPCGLPADLELADLLDAARPFGAGAPDTSLWRVAYAAGEPAGAFLALRMAHDPRTGILLYIGLLPSMRGRGLGRALHAEALWLLGSHGVRRYEDATARDNRAMRRIFERAGCRTDGRVLLFARPPLTGPPPPAQALPPPRMPAGAHVSLLRKVPCAPGSRFA